MQKEQINLRKDTKTNGSIGCRLLMYHFLSGKQIERNNWSEEQFKNAYDTRSTIANF